MPSNNHKSLSVCFSLNLPDRPYLTTMSWFLMNKKTDEKKRKEDVKKVFMKAVSMEADGKLSKDQWSRVLTEAGVKKSS